jgi:hypothetical protein
MFCGQIRGLYLGDVVGGLELLQAAMDLSHGLPGELFAALRIAQIQIEQGLLSDASATLDRTRPTDDPGRVDTDQTAAARQISSQDVHEMGRVGLNLLWMMLYNALGDEGHLQMALAVGKTIQGAFVDNPQLSEQYQMVVACKLAQTHRLLSQVVTGNEARTMHRRQALDLSQAALDGYRSYGFVRPIEATSQEILFRHGQILLLNGQDTAAHDYMQRAYDDMTEKHALIPENTLYYRTFLDNIPLHREISAAHI